MNEDKLAKGTGDKSTFNPETLFAGYGSERSGNFFRKTSEEELRWEQEQEKLRRIREEEDRRREAYKKSEEALHRVIGSGELNAAVLGFMQDRGDSALHNLMLKREDLRPLPSKFVEDFCKATRARRQVRTGLVFNFLDPAEEGDSSEVAPFTVRVIQFKNLGSTGDEISMRLDSEEGIYSKEYISSFNSLIQLYEVPEAGKDPSLPYEELRKVLAALFERVAINQHVYSETSKFSELFMKGLVELKSYYLVLTCFEYALKHFIKTTDGIEETYKHLSTAAKNELEKTSPGFRENLERAVVIEEGLKEFYRSLEEKVSQLTLDYLISNSKSYIKMCKDLEENSVSANEKKFLKTSQARQSYWLLRGTRGKSKQKVLLGRS